MPRKSALSKAAAALGRLGGQSRSPAKLRAIAQNGAQTRFQPVYRLTPSGDVEMRRNGRWITLEPPLPLGARRFLKRHGR